MRILALLFALLLAAAPLPSLAATQPSDDGLYHEPWFLFSFLDLRQDAEEAAAKGKKLVVLWSQRGCPYCKQMHENHLTNAALVNLIRDNFEVLQLDLFGSREVTDFDGKVMPEKELARRWGIVYTPTANFFALNDGKAPAKPGREIEVARMAGLYAEPAFYGIFSYVREDGWRKGAFREYLAGREKDFAARIKPNN